MTLAAPTRETAAIRERIDRHRAEIERIARAHKVARLRVFGSVARGEAGPESDLDLLVKWGEGASLFDWVGVERELSALLDTPVQLTDEDHIHWYIRDRVLAEAAPLP